MAGRVMWEQTRPVIDAAMKVHSILGPGLLEATYVACLAHELRRRGVAVRSQVPIPVVYDGMEIELGYRVDLLVDDEIVVEVKSVTKLAPPRPSPSKRTSSRTSLPASVESRSAG